MPNGAVTLGARFDHPAEKKMGLGGKVTPAANDEGPGHLASGLANSAM
jgi:hypothetical protein